MHFCKKTI